MAWLAGLSVSDLVEAVPHTRGAARVPSRETPPASADDLAYLTIAQASRMIAARTISPLDLVNACLARIESYDPEVKAWVSVFAERARAEARTAGRTIARRGPRSPLHGIPLGIKDIYDIKGMPTKCGSRVRADAPPAAHDATMVARFRAAGAILLGKTNTHEFAAGDVTSPTSNPWDPARIPGGSSGGSAAALASGMCFGANGTDTAGSIGIPASLCNVVGIKPTFGRVSKAGVFPLAWSLDTAGPLARSVEDCALLLNAIAGPDPRDPTTVSAPVPDFARGLGKRVAGRRIGVPTSIFFDGADEQTARLVREAIPVFRSLGAKVVPLEMPSTQPIAAICWFLISTVESNAVHEHYLRQRPLDYQPQTLAILQLGASWSAQQYVRAQRIRTINIREWVELFKSVDAVLTPTTPRPAPSKVEGQLTGALDLTNYTSLFDLNACPTISVPTGFTSAGLPVGLLLSARPFDEARLLQLAHAYQQETDLVTRRPPLT